MVAIVNSANFIGATVVSSHAVSLPASLVSGNLLLAFARPASVGGADMPQAQFPAGWTKLASRALATDNGESSVWGRVSNGEEGATATVTISGSLERRLCAIVYQIEAHNGLANVEIEVDPSTLGAGNTMDPPEVTAPWGSADNLFITALMALASDYTLTAPTNYAGQVTAQNTSSTGFTRSSVATAHRALTAASDNPGVWGSSGGTVQQPHAYTVVVQPGAASVNLLPSMEALYYGATRLDNKSSVEYMISQGHGGLAGDVLADGLNASTNASGLISWPISSVAGSENDPVTVHLYWEEGSDPVVDRSLIVKTTLVEDV